MNSIGYRIEKVRGSLSQSKFAKSVEITRNQISRYENGTQTPKFDFLQRVVNVYGVDAGWLITGIRKGDETKTPEHKMMKTRVIASVLADELKNNDLSFDQTDFYNYLTEICAEFMNKEKFEPKEVAQFTHKRLINLLGLPQKNNYL